MSLEKRILVAPLNWGLGHATRCIPIIKELMHKGFDPIIGSDGNALTLLKKEFPNLESVELPSYNISYSKNAKYFKFKLISNVPSIIIAIKNENKFVKEFVKTNNINGIISDNRLGLYSKQIPCVIMTHQLNVLSGNTTWFSTKLHQKFINKFDECWIPDFKGDNNLSGLLGHSKNELITTKYIGPLSRFEKTETIFKYDLMVLLSGPEPQRSLLEKQLLSQLKKYNGKVIFVKGKMATKQKKEIQNNLLIYNYMTSLELENAINESELVLSRPGYTTIMDLYKLDKKVFFIPTPGQYEQKYLAQKLKKDRVAPYCLQEEFSIEKLEETNLYNGFNNFESEVDYQNLFNLFKSE